MDVLAPTDLYPKFSSCRSAATPWWRIGYASAVVIRSGSQDEGACKHVVMVW